MKGSFCLFFVWVLSSTWVLLWGGELMDTRVRASVMTKKLAAMMSRRTVVRTKQRMRSIQDLVIVFCWFLFVVCELLEFGVCEL